MCSPEDIDRRDDKYCCNGFGGPGRFELSEHGFKPDGHREGRHAGAHPPCESAFIGKDRPILGPVGSVFCQIIVVAH